MSSYKLHYFDARGVAEPIRLLFAYANVKYEDNRFRRGPEWNQLKPTMPWNVVPVLEVDGQQISQSKAILRFLAQTFGLAPVNPMQMAKCEEYIDAIVDLRTEGKKFHREQSAEKKSQLRDEFIANHFIRYMHKFTEILKNSGSDYLVGSKLTYADIFIAYTVEQISSWIDSSNTLNEYREVKNHMDRIMNLPGIKEWVNVRPKTAS